MLLKPFILAAFLAASAVPALAQTMPSDPQQNPSAQPADPSRGPTTQQLNHASNVYTDVRETAHADYRAQYEDDRRAYIAAIEAQHHRAVNRYNRRYERQQIAYADAMAAWRRQVAACHHGNDRACEAPTPRVADFY